MITAVTGVHAPFSYLLHNSLIQEEKHGEKYHHGVVTEGAEYPSLFFEGLGACHSSTDVHAVACHSQRKQRWEP